jgi:hypothetical protein
MIPSVRIFVAPINNVYVGLGVEIWIQKVHQFADKFLVWRCGESGTEQWKQAVDRLIHSKRCAVLDSIQGIGPAVSAELRLSNSNYSVVYQVHP